MVYNQSTLSLSYEVKLNNSISDCLNFQVEYENMISSGIFNHILRKLLKFNRVDNIITSSSINVICHDSIIESIQTSRLYNSIIHMQQQQQQQQQQQAVDLEHHHDTPLQQPISSILPSTALKYGSFEKRSSSLSKTNNSSTSNKFYYYLCIGILTLVVLLGSIYSTALKNMILIQNCSSGRISSSSGRSSSRSNSSIRSCNSSVDVSNKFLSPSKNNSSALDLERAYQLNRRSNDIIVGIDRKSEENSSSIHVTVVND